jgi:hypothetical protein
MILAIAVMLLPFPGPSSASFTASPVSEEAPVASADNSGDTKSTAPNKIAPVVVPTASTQTSKSAVSGTGVTTAARPSALTPTDASLNVYLPAPPTFRPSIETVRRPSHAWFILTATEHSAAGFDAWSTRQAVSQGRVEADPLMRPFSHSRAIYGAIQVVPLGLDYVAHRMQRSSGWTRHVWWVPQSLATATFLFSGSYNFSHTR